MKHFYFILTFLFLSTFSFAQQWGAITLVSPDPVPDPLRTDGTHYFFTFEYDDLTNQNENVADITITAVRGDVIVENGPWINGSLFQYELSFTGEDDDAVFSVSAKNADGNNPGTWHSGNLALPVELIDFTVQENKNDLELTWSTASEIRNDFFTVERATDGINFSSLGIIQGAGNSTEKLDYSFLDTGVKSITEAETVYYRLMQTDMDGKTTYSPVIAAKLNKNENIGIGQIKQTATELNLSFNTGNTAGTNIVLLDLSGKIISTHTLTPTLGTNHVILDIANLPHGIYVVSVRNGYHVTAKKFIK